MRSSSERCAACSPDSGWTNPASCGQCRLSRGRDPPRHAAAPGQDVATELVTVHGGRGPDTHRRRLAPRHPELDVGVSGAPSTPSRRRIGTVPEGSPRVVVLVEGASDRAALLELADGRGDDLAARGVEVVAMGGATNVGRHARLWRERGVRIGGLCDVGEAAWFARALGVDPTPDAAGGVGVCVIDLEDELIRALGVPGVEDVIARDGRLASLRTLRRQPAQRDRTPAEQLRRFLGGRSGYKERYARLLVGAVDLDRVPGVLHAVLDHATRPG